MRIELAGVLIGAGHARVALGRPAGTEVANALVGADDVLEELELQARPFLDATQRLQLPDRGAQGRVQTGVNPLTVCLR